MNKIKFKDISELIYALCIGVVELESKLKEIQKKDYKTIEKQYIERIKKGFDALEKIRKELRLPDDPIYRNIRLGD